MSTIKVDTIATRTGSGNITLSNSLASVTVNRTGNGVAQTIQNGGTTVGEIGVNSTDNMFLVSTNTGFKLLKDEAAIAPAQSGGSNHDNALDLGFSTVRWKDLYLSGGAFIGGATAANKLDDYEEGTFTPTFGGSSGNPTVSYAVQLGTYIKVGNIVTVTASVIASGTPVGGAGDLQVKGLPFTGKSGIQQAGSVAFTNNLGTASGTTQMTCSIEGGVSFLNINSHEYSGQSSMSRTEAPAIQNSAPRIVCTICYETS